jgi:hypothetical protein
VPLDVGSSPTTRFDRLSLGGTDPPIGDGEDEGDDDDDEAFGCLPACGFCLLFVWFAVVLFVVIDHLVL